jgi:hypothetical protein
MSGAKTLLDRHDCPHNSSLGVCHFLLLSWECAWKFGFRIFGLNSYLSFQVRLGRRRLQTDHFGLLYCKAGCLGAFARTLPNSWFSWHALSQEIPIVVGEVDGLSRMKSYPDDGREIKAVGSPAGTSTQSSLH